MSMVHGYPGSNVFGPRHVEGSDEPPSLMFPYQPGTPEEEEEMEMLRQWEAGQGGGARSGDSEASGETAPGPLGEGGDDAEESYPETKQLGQNEPPSWLGNDTGIEEGAPSSQVFKGRALKMGNGLAQFPEKDTSATHRGAVLQGESGPEDDVDVQTHGRHAPFASIMQPSTILMAQTTSAQNERSPSPGDSSSPTPDSVMFNRTASPSNGSTGSAKNTNRQILSKKEPPDNAPTPPSPKRSDTRLLTEGEKQLVRSIFGDAIKDLDKVEIRNRKYIFFQPSGTTMTPNGNIYLAKALQHIKDFSQEELRLQAHLIHEMSHVWQRQNGMNVVVRGMLSGVAPYDYVLKEGKLFDQYPMEQQATIVEDYLKSLKGEVMTRKYRGKGWRIIHPPKIYEALIPWLKNRKKDNSKKTTPAYPPLP